MLTIETVATVTEEDPVTPFWRCGRGTAPKGRNLNSLGLQPQVRRPKFIQTLKGWPIRPGPATPPGFRGL
jgi:hypothetical protein